MSDLIDRRAAIDHWRSIIDATDNGDRYDMGFVDGLEFCISDLSTTPSAQPEIEERKEESAQNVLKDDLVSRKAAIDAVNGVIADYIPTLYGRYEALPLEMAMAIKRLPSAQPEQKTGRWIERDSNGVWQCDQCRKYCLIYKAHHCPNCGAYMGGDAE